MLKRIVEVCAFALILVSVGFWMGRRTAPPQASVVEVQRDTITYVDTIKSFAVSDVVVVCEVEREFVKVEDVEIEDVEIEEESEEEREEESEDSVRVIVPISQTKYETEDLTVWASGYEVSVDSAMVHRRDVVVREVKPGSRWSIGVMAGIGTGRDMRIEPMLGIGLCYKIDLGKRYR